MLLVGIVGYTGLVGKEVYAQLPNLLAKDSILKTRLSIAGVCSSSHYRLSTGSGESVTSKNLPDDFVDAIYKNYHSEKLSLVIIDCTASQAVADLYPKYLKRGINLVTPNKLPFSGSMDLYRSIKDLSSYKGTDDYPKCYHESTVGAGLPVVATLKDLVATGDEIHRIEGILSGTLSFLFNEFMPVSSSTYKPFSEIVTTAKSLGYTEPDPRDDLNGIDVARKLIILGRLCGYQLDSSTVKVDNIVPANLRSCKTSEEFLSQLPQFDAEFEAMRKDYEKKGLVMRHVASCSDGGKVATVSLKGYGKDHPFANLKGSDNIVAFYTKRFPNGLIIQGSGAGAAVTSHGIISDLLKILN